MHWQRQRRTGEIGAALPTRRIAESRTSHEMYQTWDNARRRDLDPAWADFDTFVAGIGERPSRKHRLVRKVLKLPLGPNNFEWRAALISKLPEETKTDFNRRYKAAMREQFGHGHREHDLLGKYGLTLPKLAAMAEAQNHKCAICGDAETTLRKGRPVHLAVDHDHKPGGKVRALLCVACNTGLGKFRDDPELLLKAVAYLVKHREAA